MIQYSLLIVTDGTTEVNLLSETSGFHLKSWMPVSMGMKDEGIWQSNSLADGRRLVDYRYDNVIDSFTFAVRGQDQNALIRNTQDLRRLLTKALNYFKTEWQKTPVYLIAKAACETNTRYALIVSFQAPGDGNPIESPFANTSYPVSDEWNLIIEHAPWQAYPPGQSGCVMTKSLMDAAYSNWSQNSDLPVNQVTSMLSLSSGRLLAGEDQEIWHTDDGGATAWIASTTPVTGIPFSMIQLSTGRVVALCSNGIQYSDDEGDNWINLGIGTASSNYYYNLAKGRNDSLIAIDEFGFNWVRLSTDLGINWTTVLDHTTILQPYRAAAATQSYYYIICEGGMVQRSTDGTTWSYIGKIPVLPSDTPTCVYCDGETVYIGFNDATIWMSTDHGISWSKQADLSAGADSILSILKDTGTGLFYVFTSVPDVWVGYDISGLTDLAYVSLPSAAYSSAEYATNHRVYAGCDGEIYVSALITSLGSNETCNDDVLVANKQNTENVVSVLVYDDSGGTYTSQFPAASFPFDLLPAVPDTSDSLYVGFASFVANGHSANNLVFDIGSPPSYDTRTFVWEYSQGGGSFATLTCNDETKYLENIGVQVLTFVPPSDWAEDTIDGVSAYWIRLRVDAITVSVSPPTQQNINIYSCTRASIDIEEDQVGGDIPASARILVHQRSGESGGGVDAWTNKLQVSLRSLNRGSQFSAFINCSSYQNPYGITVTGTASTTQGADLEAPSGRYFQHIGTGTSTWADQLTINLIGETAKQYFGRFRAYLRAYQGSGSSGDVRIRLKIIGGSGGLNVTKDFTTFAGAGAGYEWQLLDLGDVNLPPTTLLNFDEMTDRLQLVLQIWSSSAIVVNLYDLVLMPADEWMGDFVDNALLSTSRIYDGQMLDIDGVTMPKESIRALARIGSSDGDMVFASYSPNTVGPTILQANVDQRLWFLASRYDGTAWHSEPWLLHSIRTFANPKYLSMRGDR